MAHTTRRYLNGPKKTSRNGLSNTAEYAAWVNLMHRCTNPNHAQYPNYGGRGITVCDRWKDFLTFYKDMGSRPTAEHSLDRINNNKGYFPKNCRWATRTEQQRNQRGNRVIVWNGKAQTLIEWAEEYHRPYALVMDRVERGWSIEDAVTTPNQFRRHDYAALIGQKFGRLLVRNFYTKKINNKTVPFVYCECDCGTMTHRRFYRVFAGDTQSCGCLARKRAV